MLGIMAFGATRGWSRSSGWYDLTQRLLGKARVYRMLLDEYARPAAGMRVLDVGCGTGGLLGYLPAVDYVGFDASARHVDRARRRFGARGQFLVADVLDVKLPAASFDLAFAVGVLHHLDDARVRACGRVIARSLKPDGRAVLLEPCRLPRQPLTATVVHKADRGAFIRSREDYERLLEAGFAEFRVSPRLDVLRFPTAHVVIECRR
jgi:SAM-dependent methyltransferase